MTSAAPLKEVLQSSFGGPGIALKARLLQLLRVVVAKHFAFLLIVV